MRLLAGLALLLLAAGPARAEASPAAAPGSIRLVLLIAVDQLRADRLDPRLPGGLGRIAREGRVFTRAALEHADTETCPGHATMLTGHDPGPAGVPGNEFIERATGRKVYCVEDPAAPTLGGKLGRSPRLMRVTTLGDWMKSAWPESRVYAVSAKDRAAITLGGQHPDAAWWLDLSDVHGFTTSRYYRSALPDWVRRFDGGDPPRDGFLARVPERWEHPTDAPANGAAPDDFPGESTRFSRTSPHPIRDPDLSTFVGNFFFTPFVDQATLDFARTLMQQEKLGRGPRPDLLAISLSATDTVGHLYGPESQEARDALLRLDAWLDDFLRFVEGQVGGPQHLLLALTADHGVLPLPEWLEREGRDACPVPGGRVSVRRLGFELLAKLHLAFSPFSWPKPWILIAGYQLTVNRTLAAAHGVSPEAVAAEARAFLQHRPGVERIWTAQEMARGAGPEPFASLYHDSYDPERSGDLALQPAEDCLFSSYDTGTSHGTPWPYDRAVPLVLVGPGISPGATTERAAPVDLAPTLAARLGLAVPAGLDGQPLSLGPPEPVEPRSRR